VRRIPNYICGILYFKFIEIDEIKWSSNFELVSERTSSTMYITEREALKDLASFMSFLPRSHCMTSASYEQVDKKRTTGGNHRNAVCLLTNMYGIIRM
jgi:hypothetical protein